MAAQGYGWVRVVKLFAILPNRGIQGNLHSHTRDVYCWLNKRGWLFRGVRGAFMVD